MQLFGLVNTLLANDPTSLRKNLRYAGQRALSCPSALQSRAAVRWVIRKTLRTFRVLSHAVPVTTSKAQHGALCGPRLEILHV